MYKKRNYGRNGMALQVGAPATGPQDLVRISFHLDVFPLDTEKTLFPENFQDREERVHTSQLFCWLKTCKFSQCQLQFGTTVYQSVTVLLLPGLRGKYKVFWLGLRGKYIFQRLEDETYSTKHFVCILFIRQQWYTPFWTNLCYVATTETQHSCWMLPNGCNCPCLDHFGHLQPLTKRSVSIIYTAWRI